MSKKKKKTTEKKRSPSSSMPTEVRGLLFLTLSFVTLLSLLSFSYSQQTDNWLGLIGYTIGWILHATFGISSYPMAIYLGWMGWNMLFLKPYENLRIKSLYFSVFIFSLSILLSLLEEQSQGFKSMAEMIFYPNLPISLRPYHLGGLPFFYLYRELPLFNLQNILNSLGVGIIFTGTLLASLIFLFQWNIAQIAAQLKAWWNSPKNEQAPQLETTQQKTDFMRYVKLRIPGSGAGSGDNMQQSDNIPNQNSHSQTTRPDLLGIQPETELKARPSLSNKEKKEQAASPPIKTTIKTSSDLQTIENKIAAPRNKREEALKAQSVINGDFSEYKLPGPNLLTIPKKIDQSSLKRDLKRQAEVLEETLQSFGIEAKVGQINCGPTITSFEVHPSIGVKVQKIKALESDIALNMEAKSIRIIAPIPGKAAVGIEVPNPQPQEVGFKELLSAYQQAPHKLHIPLLLGKAVNGDYVISDLAKMPHLIIAGATGSGKSVCINTIVMSILYSAKPDEVQLLMVDPKKVELTPYTHLPHMIAPVITEPHGAYAALQWLVKEMESRYEILKQIGVRNIEGFNNRKINKELEESLKIEVPTKLPYIVGIVDELADLMMAANTDIETPIARIAQMARAVGIHLILATQRPSREVITGLIKANFPARISFKVASRVNSQIVLDEIGAESLLGNGDMLFLPPGSSQLMRAQGAYIRDEDIHAVIKHHTEQSPPRYRIPSFDKSTPQLEDGNSPSSNRSADTLFEQAVDIVTSTGNASTTFLQRKLKIGYPSAARLMDQLEAEGVVSPAEGSRPRRVLQAKGKEDLDEEVDE